jgi:hypothetical protein
MISGITLDAVRQAQKLQRAAVDPAYFISSFLKTFDPRIAPYDLPFELYDYQVELVQWLHSLFQTPADGLIEKSRDMGVTYTILAYIVWLWRFQPGFQALIGSRKEPYVDDGTMKSLFGMLMYMIEHMDPTFWPKGENALGQHVAFDPKKNKTFMKIVNPVNGNTISGESTNPHFSRQSRVAIILLDEFAFWEWAESAWLATADSSPCRIVVSTPNGRNFFADLRNSGRIQVRTIHWSKHPNKSQEWYENEKLRRSEEEVSQELDISYDRSIKGRVYPEWDNVPRGVFPYQPGWPLYASWDFGYNPDPTALIFWQLNVANGFYRIIDYYQNDSKVIDFYAPFVTGEVPSGTKFSYTQDDLDFITKVAGWGPSINYGDPAGKQRNQVTGTSPIGELKKLGVTINTRPDVNKFDDRYKTTQLFIRKIEGIHYECVAVDEALKNSRFPDRNPNSQSTTAPSRPVHDWTSHFRTAVEFMAVNIKPRKVEEFYSIPRVVADWEGMV